MYARCFMPQGLMFVIWAGSVFHAGSRTAWLGRSTVRLSQYMRRPRVPRLTGSTTDALCESRAGFDVVVLVKGDAPSLITKLRRASRARLIYGRADVQQARAAKGVRSINEILASVDAVTVDNPLGRAYARKHARSVFLWPPAAYVEAFDHERAKSRRGRDGRIVIGWIGTPTTASNLYLVLESLEDVFRRHPNVELRLVGMPEDHDLLHRFEHVRASCRPTYQATSMVGEVIDMDIGLFPSTSCRTRRCTDHKGVDLHGR